MQIKGLHRKIKKISLNKTEKGGKKLDSADIKTSENFKIIIHIAYDTQQKFSKENIEKKQKS